MTYDRDEVRRLEREMEESGLKHPPVYHPPEAPAPTGERELDPVEYSHPTELEAQLAEQWLRAYAKRTRIHHWTLDQLLSQKYQVAAFAHWYTGHLKSSVLQEVRKQVEALHEQRAIDGIDDVLALLDRMEGK